MCFVIHKDHPNVLVAKKDIPCWKKVYRVAKKRGSGYYKSQAEAEFRRFVYKFNKVYKVRSFRYYPNKGFITRGFHSYCFKLRTRYTIIRCVIPKGTKYYFNPAADEYVSLAIKPIKYVTSKPREDQF